MKPRCRYFDQAVSALIEDIHARGLDRRVLVVVTGEFGRTPQDQLRQGLGLGRDAAGPRPLAARRLAALGGGGIGAARSSARPTAAGTT